MCRVGSYINQAIKKKECADSIMDIQSHMTGLTVKDVRGHTQLRRDWNLGSIVKVLLEVTDLFLEFDPLSKVSKVVAPVYL